MKITTDENGYFLLEEVFSPIELFTRAGESMTIQMRDSGFEITYQGEQYTAQKGKLTKVKNKPQ